MRPIKFRTLIIIWLSIFTLTFVSFIIYQEFSTDEKEPVQLTMQYFEDCIYASDLIKNTKSAITELNLNIELNEILINTDELADKHKFRGSPTLLINGSDLMNMPEPTFGSISCRVYKDGLPSTETIKNRIKEEINKSK